jgi:hypothetical protein
VVPFNFSVVGNPVFKSTSFHKPPGKDAGRKLHSEWAKMTEKGCSCFLKRGLDHNAPEHRYPVLLATDMM